MTADLARDLRHELSDPVKLCRSLGLDKGSKPQRDGVMIVCPSHKEKSPSCSVTIGDDGTVRVHCFACDWSTDALGLIAKVHGLDVGAQFPEVLGIAGDMAGYRRSPFFVEPVPRRRGTMPTTASASGTVRSIRDYPPPVEVRALWTGSKPVTDDSDACRYLVSRCIDPELVAARRLARSIARPLPPWAAFGKASWLESGHRVVCRMFDADGVVRSVRAIRIVEGDSPKRLPPRGFRANALVLANEGGWQVLRRHKAPQRVIIVEGEPDFLTWGVITEEPVLGVVAGSWTEKVAARIPRDSTVIVRTHTDETGDRYAAAIVASLGARGCAIRRLVQAGAAP